MMIIGGLELRFHDQGVLKTVVEFSVQAIPG
jgi:hypothetical protein